MIDMTASLQDFKFQRARTWEQMSLISKTYQAVRVASMRDGAGRCKPAAWALHSTCRYLGGSRICVGTNLVWASACCLECSWKQGGNIRLAMQKGLWPRIARALSPLGNSSEGHACTPIVGLQELPNYNQQTLYMKHSWHDSIETASKCGEITPNPKLAQASSILPQV